MAAKERVGPGFFLWGREVSHGQVAETVRPHGRRWLWVLELDARQRRQHGLAVARQDERLPVIRGCLRAAGAKLRAVGVPDPDQGFVRYGDLLCQAPTDLSVQVMV